MSSAVVVVNDSVGSTTQEVPPSPDPGWSYVGVLGPGTGVYLGSGIVLTASHVAVGASPVITLPNPGDASNSTSYSLISGSACRVQNPTGLTITQPDSSTVAASTLTDLAVYGVSIPAGSPHSSLAPLPISATALSIGDAVTMIGTGREQGGATTNGFSSTGRDQIWGTNTVSSVSIAVTTGSGDVVSFATTFNGDAGGTEAQAQTSDSGGAVFHLNSTTSVWELAGIIHAVGSPTTTTAATKATYGDQTFAASLAGYVSHGAGSISSCVSSVTAVPEPSSYLMLMLVGFVAVGRRWCSARAAFC